MITLENERLRIGFSETSGAVVALADKAKRIEYIKTEGEAGAAVPFRLERGGELSGAYTSFEYARDEDVRDGEGFVFRWQVAPDIHVTAKVVVPRGTGEAVFVSEVANGSGEAIPALEYPILSGFRPITPGGEKDFLAHSFATGFLIRNPAAAFPGSGDGFRFMPYPEGFSGATMQFFTYYGEKRGGLYFAVYDGEHYSKWLNFYKNGHGGLEASFLHGYEDIGPGKGIRAEYPVVVKLMDEGSWYEAAEEYKRWAVRQKWTGKGQLSELDDGRKAKWLLEEAGLSTFGINAGYDRSQWIETYSRLTDTGIFHVLGPDWPATGQNYHNHVPGGLDDWFPVKLNPESVAEIRRQGDKFAPFEFDYLFNFGGADGDRGKAARQAIPPARSIDKYPFPFICPAAPYTKELHVGRDERLAKEAGVDAIYYDISANNIMKVCMDDSHGHPVGAGKTITEAYRDNYRSTKEAMDAVSGTYVPMGTEMVNEVFIDVLDYYQARAGAQPATDFEGWNIRGLLKSGDAELIPMFTYVYHEYAPVRLDGWGNLTEEIGRLFYFTVARTYLWGGIYELNYEYCPMELLNGRENSAEEHYYRFEPRGYELSPERGAYIRQFAALRTGAGNKYLAYGTMLRPLEFANPPVTLDWFHYNSGKETAAYNDRGRMQVPSIVHSAWAYKDESVGLFFANVAEEDQTVAITVPVADYGLRPRSFRVNLVGDSGETLYTLAKEIGPEGSLELTVTVPGKQVVLLDIH